MNTETLAAVHGSIKKWEGIVDGTGEDNGTDNCPLCALFYGDQSLWRMCQRCPVYEVTGRPICEGSPFQDWARYMAGAGRLYPYRVFDDRSRVLAEAELNFLRELLPEGAS